MADMKEVVAALWLNPYGHNAAIAMFDMLKEYEAQVRAREDAVAAAEQERTLAVRAIADKRQAVAAREVAIAELAEARTERDAAQAERDAAKAERDEARAERDAARAERDAAIADKNRAESRRAEDTKLISDLQRGRVPAPRQ